MRDERTRPPRAARLPPAERRAQLLQATLAVFARRGLGGSRHADVASEAGVSLPAVFHYFPTREALVDAVLDEIERFYIDQARDAARTAHDRPAREQLVVHARVFARSVDTHPHHTRVWLDWSTAVDDGVWRRYVRFSERVLRDVQGALRRGRRDGSVARDVVCEDAARVFVAAAYAVMQLKLTGASAAKVERLLQSVVRAVSGTTGA